jgi:hypothetical protein
MQGLRPGFAVEDNAWLGTLKTYIEKCAARRVLRTGSRKLRDIAFMDRNGSDAL